MAKGVKTGGRAKGTRNKATAAKAREVAESGLTPLDYMLDLLRSEMPPELKERVENEALSVDVINAISEWHAQRFEAAKAAAPYLHPRLASETVKVSGSIEINKIERVVVRKK